MNTRKKGVLKRIDGQESDQNRTHPSENELQDWTLVPDAFAVEEFERIKEHVDSCDLCKVYCALVRAAEKEVVKAHLQTETGRNWCRNLLHQIALACSVDCPCQVACHEGVGRDGPTPSPLTGRVINRPAPNEPSDSSGEVADVTEAYRTELADRLVGLFFPPRVVHDTIKRRLCEQTVAKLAMGSVCSQLLTTEPHTRVFVESGSTPALSSLAIPLRWNEDRITDTPIDLKTNNSLVHKTMCGLQGIEPRVLYGDKWFNQKYGGYFPVSEADIVGALQGDKRCLKLVRKAWPDLLTVAWTFDRLFMTASRFNFFAGPFVGSRDNALLKTAFYTCGRRLTVLLDGSKVIRNDQLWKEWQAERCIQIFDQDASVGTVRFLKATFGVQNPTTEMLRVKSDAAKKNPCVRLNLTDELISTNGSDDDIEHIETPGSWGECVENVLRRNGGELCVYVSEPLSEKPEREFGKMLGEAVDEGNECFERAKSPVRIDEPTFLAVRVAPDIRSFLPEEATYGKEVLVWKCPLMLVEQDRIVDMAGKEMVHRGRM